MAGRVETSNNTHFTGPSMYFGVLLEFECYYAVTMTLMTISFFSSAKGMIMLIHKRIDLEAILKVYSGDLQIEDPITFSSYQAKYLHPSSYFCCNPKIEIGPCSAE